LTDTPKLALRGIAQKYPQKWAPEKVLDTWFNGFSNGTTIAGKWGVFYSVFSIVK